MKINELLQSTSLTELKMSPGSLKAMAAQVPGALVGMEFEMYVPNVEGGGGDDTDWDLDMDMDGYIDDSDWKSFKNDLATFYSSGDFSEGGKSYYERQIDDKIFNDYLEWADGKFYEWTRDGAFEEWYKEENPDEEVPREDSRGWHNAMDDFRDEKYDEFLQDEGSIKNWLEEEGIDRYYTIGDRYGWSWPHLTTSGGAGEESMESVGQDFENAVGIDVDVSSEYHGRRKSTENYTLEPDSSLSSPASEYDRGLEFVSPPLTIDQMIDQLQKVKRWADGYGAYTNASCGLHINVSVPNFDMKKLDYVKLALFVGDDWVAEQFGRLGASWCRSSLEQVKQRVKTDPDKIPGYLDAMKKGFAEIAAKLIHSGHTDKYVTLNTKDNRVEFRAPGGDWLNTDLNKLINTMLRFVVALDIAMDPAKERREYATKMYKLIDSVKVIDDVDTIKYFAQYSAKQLPTTALKSFVRNIQQKRSGKKPVEGQNNYQITFYGADGKEQTITVPASSRREAVDRFRIDWPVPEYSIKTISGDDL
jgi:hypothetical protein